VGRLVGQARPIERHHYWQLPLAGRRVVRWDVAENALSMELHIGLGERAEVWLSARIELVTAEGVRGVTDPRAEPTSRLRPILQMLDAEVGEARAWKDGRLEIKFVDAGGFVAMPENEGRSWQVSWWADDPPRRWKFSAEGHTLVVESQPHARR
jgi:Family of unknown function (DUF6188)